MKNTISLVLVLALGLAAEVANADFTFGTPTNLGPTVNSSFTDNNSSITADGLELYFHSTRPGGLGLSDIWVTTRETTRQMTESVWGTPVNLGLTVNSSNRDSIPWISSDGLSLYFTSDRPGGHGDRDLWMTTRQTRSDLWTDPANLGPIVNSSYRETGPCISADGLSLYFYSNRPDGYGDFDLWVTTRATTSEPWAKPMNMGPTINTPYRDSRPNISADGLTLFLTSNRPGGYGEYDLWVANREAKGDDWNTPVNLRPTVNTIYSEHGSGVSADGATLYFTSDRPGGIGNGDIWQVSIEPIVDLNGDGIVDALDMCIIVDHWGTDEPLCDIGPMPWGDGIVDVQDLIVLAEHLFEEIPPAE